MLKLEGTLKPLCSPKLKPFLQDTWIDPGLAWAFLVRNGRLSEIAASFMQLVLIITLLTGEIYLPPVDSSYNSSPYTE